VGPPLSTVSFATGNMSWSKARSTRVFSNELRMHRIWKTTTLSKMNHHNPAQFSKHGCFSLKQIQNRHKRNRWKRKKGCIPNWWTDRLCRPASQITRITEYRHGGIQKNQKVSIHECDPLQSCTPKLNTAHWSLEPDGDWSQRLAWRCGYPLSFFVVLPLENDCWAMTARSYLQSSQSAQWRFDSAPVQTESSEFAWATRNQSFPSTLWGTLCATTPVTAPRCCLSACQWGYRRTVCMWHLSSQHNLQMLLQLPGDLTHARWVEDTTGSSKTAVDLHTKQDPTWTWKSYDEHPMVLLDPE